ncbi:MAG: iron-containing alcohol dehydrogenase [Pelotomaculum sp.]|uniref:Alcohol dehydrogenase n=1 Tax=Pelotomaculum thermopropionicum (strain DSM 13744 / JCM 10971 / SI) TaxID=370438 RepID=A5D528_PELTS|nr:iron-containing alcohol dehydrogenase [Pelotomaculum sp.]BAF58669.1 alcohol dehydrogenase [Pelotomaculum thermopropionicum SI]
MAGYSKWFRVPRDIVFGWGSLEYLKELEGKRAFIVTDKTMQELGFVDKVKSYLAEAGIESAVFNEVEPDPSRQTVKKGARLMEQFQPDLIVGLGGGSSLDAGKGMWIFYEYPDAKWEDIFVPFTGVPKLRNKARYVAIPSTSGTATEVTLAAVITNRDVVPNVKDFTLSYEVTPDIAICDPELPSTMPPAVTANTGFDVIVHAVEAYVSVNATDVTDPIALRSAAMAYKWLPLAFANGGNKEAREKMHTASLMAGFTFTNTALGLVHSTAHQIGAEYGVPHGRANAIMLPYVVQYNAPAAAARYADMAQAFGYASTDPFEGTVKFIDAVRKLQKILGIPACLKDAGIKEEDFLKKVDMLTKNAMNDGSTPANPRVPTLAEIKNIFLCAYYGNDVI